MMSCVCSHVVNWAPPIVEGTSLDGARQHVTRTDPEVALPKTHRGAPADEIAVARLEAALMGVVQCLGKARNM